MGYVAVFNRPAAMFFFVISVYNVYVYYLIWAFWPAKTESTPSLSFPFRFQLSHCFDSRNTYFRFNFKFNPTLLVLLRTISFYNLYLHSLSFVCEWFLGIVVMLPDVNLRCYREPSECVGEQRSPCQDRRVVDAQHLLFFGVEPPLWRRWCALDFMAAMRSCIQ